MTESDLTLFCQIRSFFRLLVLRREGHSFRSRKMFQLYVLHDLKVSMSEPSPRMVRPRMVRFSEDLLTILG